VTILDRRLAGRIRGLAAGGGCRVLAVGALPRLSREPGGDAAIARSFRRLASAGRIVLFPAGNDARFLRAIRPLAEVVAAPASERLLVHHRREDDRNLYFVANMSRSPYRGRLAFSGSGRLLEWNPESGARSGPACSARGGRTSAAVLIPALGARFFTVEKDTASGGLSEAAGARRRR
jgi:hypothetical protein